MKRIAVAVSVGSIAAVGGFYIASPFLAIQGMRNGFLSRNADQVNQYIDYPSLQSDLKTQLGSMMLKSMQTDLEMAANPFSGFAIAMITPLVNTMVDTYVTPSGMKTILESNATQESDTAQDQTTQNLVERKKEFDKALQKTAMGYDGLDKFRLTATGDDGKNIKLIFNRQGFAEWKLKSVILPQP